MLPPIHAYPPPPALPPSLPPSLLIVQLPPSHTLQKTPFPFHRPPPCLPLHLPASVVNLLPQSLPPSTTPNKLPDDVRFSDAREQVPPPSCGG